VTVSTSHLGLPAFLLKLATGPVTEGGQAKHSVEAAGTPQRPTRGPHFSKTWEDLVAEQNEQEDSPPQQRATLLPPTPLLLNIKPDLGEAAHLKTSVEPALTGTAVAAKSLGNGAEPSGGEEPDATQAPANGTSPKHPQTPGENFMQKQSIRVIDGVRVVRALANAQVPASAPTQTGIRSLPPGVPAETRKSPRPSAAATPAGPGPDASPAREIVSATVASENLQLPDTRASIVSGPAMGAPVSTQIANSNGVTPILVNAETSRIFKARTPVGAALRSEPALGKAPVFAGSTAVTENLREDDGQPLQPAPATGPVTPTSEGAPEASRILFDHPSPVDFLETRNLAAPPRSAEGRVPVASPERAPEGSPEVSPGRSSSEPGTTSRESTPAPAVKSDPNVEPPTLAFAARLTLLAAPDTPSEAAPERPGRTLTAAISPQARDPHSAGEMPLPDQAVTEGQPRSAPDNHPVPGNHSAPPEPHPASRSDEAERTRSAPDSNSVPTSPAGTPSLSNGSTTVAGPVSEHPPVPPRAAPPEPMQPVVRTEAETQPETAKLVAPAREIQVQVNRGEQRVDVRLTERSGEVLVAVRTPDTQLAGTLREDLPSLSSRLEQSGFRTETWHPAMNASENRFRSAESHSPGNSPEDSNRSRQGGQEQQQSPPRQPKSPALKAGNSSPRKEFAWIMSQLP